MIAGMAMLRAPPHLAQVADVAAFLASDRASGITATTANVTCGLIPGQARPGSAGPGRPAQDLVQETFPRAWRRRDSFEGRGSGLAVVQLLPPRQRAVLILRDVLDWSARKAAGVRPPADL
jgi:hypothetical protein